jgi:NADH:ubiquinone oxidoreductase subunit 4 (subunit M)
MVGLTALLTATAILATRDQQPRPGLFFPLLLAVNLGLVGAFLARNALLFVLCFELILIPTTLLVAIWGGERRAGGAIRYLIYSAFRASPCWPPCWPSACSTPTATVSAMPIWPPLISPPRSNG